MNDKPLPDDLAEKIIRQLERDSADIDPAISSRLRVNRIQALERSGEPTSPGFRRWLTVSGMVTAVILVIAVSLWIRTPKSVPSAIHPEDIEVLISPEQIELYRDLDFYRWLDGGGDESNHHR